MARKGFWQRLFGGGDDPGNDKPDKKPPESNPEQAPQQPAEDTTPEDETPDSDPATWHEPDPADPDEPGDEAKDPDDPTPPPPPDEQTEPREAASPAGEQPGGTAGGSGADDTVTSHAEPEPPAPAPGSEGPETRPVSETTLPETAELKTDAVGRVYAQSLLEMAQEQGQADAVAQEIAALLPLVEPGGDLHRLVTNPAISTDERAKIVTNIFEGRVSDLLYRFLQVVTRKGRLGSLDTILGGYLLGVSEASGKIDVEAYVASAMDADTAARVAEKIGASLGKQVTLRQHVDGSLIGGLKIKIGDKLIDASVASQLNQMKRNMMQGRGA